MRSCRHTMSAVGPLRHFAVLHQFGRYWCIADSAIHSADLWIQGLVFVSERSITMVEVRAIKSNDVELLFGRPL